MKAAKALTAAALVAAVAGGCSGHGSTPGAAPAATPSQVATTSTPSPTVPGTGQGLSAQQVANSGLPSTVGAGELSTPTLKRLVQYFEDKVSKAYASGDAGALSHYLAGPMLSGNRATIGLLNSKHRRNVFRIHVQSVQPESNQKHQVILRMVGDMTVNYFFDPRTHKVLDHGLPGPSQVRFVVFLNQNPATGTWYWTGEKADTSSSSGTADTVG